MPTARSRKTATAEGDQAWRNIVTLVAKVAETLDEFRGRYRYNLMDDNIRRFNAEVPQIWQWDDHEVASPTLVDSSERRGGRAPARKRTSC